MMQAIPKMATPGSVNTFTTTLLNFPPNISYLFRSRGGTVLQSEIGASAHFLSTTKLRLLHSKTTVAALENEFSSAKFTDSSQGVRYGGEEFLTRLLARRWTLANPDTKISKVMFSATDTNLHDFSASNLFLGVDTDICMPNDVLGTDYSNQSFYIVRDDLLHPLINGNKARKLDGVLPLIEDNSVTDVIVGINITLLNSCLEKAFGVTCGGCQSAHAAATAVLCAERGLRSHLLLRGEQPEFLTGYNLMSTIYGNVTYVPRSIYAKREKVLKSQADLVAGNSGSVLWFDDILSTSIGKQPRSHGRRVIVINEGAGDAIALLGLIRLVKYLSQDHLLGKHRVIKFVVDAGTGTTAIGLSLGALCLGLPWEVTAVMLADRIDGYKRQEKRLISEFMKHFGAPLDLGKDEEVNGGIVNWVERLRRRKFGNVLDGEVETCRQIAQKTGILVDPIYTLAAWEMATFLSQKGAKANGDLVVLLHTGGTLGLFGLAQRYKSYFSDLKNFVP